MSPLAVFAHLMAAGVVFVAVCMALTVLWFAVMWVWRKL